MKHFVKVLRLLVTWLMPRVAHTHNGEICKIKYIVTNVSDVFHNERKYHP